MFLPLLLAVSNMLIGQTVSTDNFIDNVNANVHQMIEKTDDVPGLQCGSFNHLRSGVNGYWNTLVSQGVLEVQGQDKEIRPYFVAIQGIVEHVFSKELNGNITNFVAIIHSALPAAPICTAGEVSEEIVQHRASSASPFTVKPRTTIFRDYLYQGGTLYIVYPENGLSQRMQVQQNIYKNELSKYPKNLLDRPCHTTNMPTALAGSTYFIKDKNGRTYVFAVKMTPTGNPQDMSQFSMWFGPLENPQIQARVNEVFNYTQENAYTPINFS